MSSPTNNKKVKRNYHFDLSEFFLVGIISTISAGIIISVTIIIVSLVSGINTLQELQFITPAFDILYPLPFATPDFHSSVSLERSDCLLEILEDYDPTEGLEGEELFKYYAKEICKNYENVEPEIIISQMYFESRFNPDAKNGKHYGLMQINHSIHSKRMSDLGVTDLWDPYSNILVAVDLMDDLITNYANGDIGYALMLYSMSWSSAKELHKNGKLNSYAKDVLTMAEEIKEGQYA